MPADRFHQPLLELTLEQADYFANSLKREAAPAEVADHGNFRDVVEAVQAAMSFACRDYDLALIPPLQLAGTDTGQPDHFRRCEFACHASETFRIENV